MEIIKQNNKLIMEQGGLTKFIDSFSILPDRIMYYHLGSKYIILYTELSSLVIYGKQRLGKI